jgi:hypothetical protein
LGLGVLAAGFLEGFFLPTEDFAPRLPPLVTRAVTVGY